MICSLLYAAITLFLLQIAHCLEITQPSSAHWWIAQSLNTLAWTADPSSPSEFSVFITNPDTSILTDKLALISIEPAYEYSKTVNPGSLTPGGGYTIQLTDPINSTHIYASSDVFEVKAVGSAYPPQTSGSTKTTAVMSGTVSGGTATGSAAVSTQTGGVERTVSGVLAIGGWGLVGVVGLQGIIVWIGMV